MVAVVTSGRVIDDNLKPNQKPNIEYLQIIPDYSCTQYT